ncbi:MAG: MFS transporter [Bacteroidales bacterium]|nr:MFS transporter [Bacteroidales bacterium]
MNKIKDPSTRRWIIVATMFLAIICNYLDRQLLSILKPEILGHYGIGDYEYAWIVNVFLVCYAVMYPLSGMLVDRFGPKKVLFWGITVWSLACIGGGLAPNVGVFAVCRGILGLAEPTIFAGQLVAVTLWFEKRQRATANSLCTVGGSLGAVIAPLLIAWLMRILGNWQHVFFISGGIGLALAAAWTFVYRTPSQEILDRTIGTDTGSTGGEKFSFRGLFNTRTLWGGILIRLVSDPVWYFCCFWLPGFLRNMGSSQGLSTQQTLDMIQWIGGIPFLIGAIGGILTSVWSDRMISHGMPALKARKKMMVTIAFIAPLCALVPFINSSSAGFGLKVGLIVGIFSLVAVMCLSWLYTLPVVLAETFPIGNVATVMGLSCGAGALGSVVFNLFTGSIPESGWKWLFILMGTLHLIAAVILTKMVRPEHPDKQRNIQVS